MSDTMEIRLREALAAARDRLKTAEAKQYCDKLMGQPQLNLATVKSALAELQELSATSPAAVMDYIPLQLILEYYLAN